MASIDELLAKRAKRKRGAERVVTEAPPGPQTERVPISVEINSGIDYYPEDPAWYQSISKGAIDRFGDAADLLLEAVPGGEHLQGLTENDPYNLGEAEGPTGKAFEAAGSMMVDALPFAPMAAAAGPLVGVSPVVAALSEMGLAGVGGFLQSDLEERGHPGLGLAAAIVPGVASGGAAKAGQAVLTRSGEAYKTIAKITGPAADYTGKLGVTRRSLVRSSEEAKMRVADVEAFTEALKRGEDLNKRLPEDGGLTTRQIADDMPHNRGGPHWSAMEERISRDDIPYGTRAALRKANTLDYLAERWEELGGEEGSNFVEFLARYDDGMRDLKTQERVAWRDVRKGEIPTFDISSIQRYIAKEMRGLKFTDDKNAIPAVFEDLLNTGLFPHPDDPKELAKHLDLNDFQDARSIMLEVMREAKMSPTKENRRAAKMVVPVLERMQKIIKKWEDTDEGVDGVKKSLEYANARRLTLENKHLYDMDSPVLRVLEQGGTQKNLFTSMRNARGKKGNRLNPETEARRLLRIAQQTPNGEKNLRKMAIEDLFDQAIGFNPNAVRTPLKTLKNNSQAYKVVLGEDYDKAVELLEMSSIATRGKAGTGNQAMSTGSGISPARFLFGLASEMMQPVPGRGVARKVAGVVKEGMTKNELMIERIMVAAMEDPKLMRILMEMPTEAALPAWEIGWRQLLRQAGGSTTRQGIRATAAGSLGE